MNLQRISLIVAAVASLLLVPGCSTTSREPLQTQFGESVVFIGTEPAALAHPPTPGKRFAVRNTYLPGVNTVEYVEGRDFVVDYSQGTIRRLAGSRLPDFQTNLLYGQKDFDHTKFPGFGNNGFFAFVDYSFVRRNPWPIELPQIQFLRATQAKLKAGKPVKIVAYGDSITAGGEASTPGLIFWMRWVDALQRKYPQARITAINGATGGDSTVQGLQRLQTKVLEEKPDLVLVGFGMNDHNIGGVPIPQFEQNLKQIVARIRNETGAEVILFSAFPPNPHWKFGSHQMEEYEAATYRVARDMSCAFADVFNNWQALAARKKPEDLLGNDINHPNDFGHWIYFRVFEGLEL
jgi:acyl-CoA thioesterase-1